MPLVNASGASSMVNSVPSLCWCPVRPKILRASATAWYVGADGAHAPRSEQDPDVAVEHQVGVLGDGSLFRLAEVHGAGDRQGFVVVLTKCSSTRTIWLAGML